MSVRASGRALSLKLEEWYVPFTSPLSMASAGTSNQKVPRSTSPNVNTVTEGKTRSKSDYSAGRA